MQVTVDQLMELPEIEILRKDLNTRMEEEKRRRKKFYKEVQEDQKAEFINGKVIVHSPARLVHIEVQERIFALLHNHVRLHNLGVIGYDKLMVNLTRNDYEPDICYFSSERSKDFQPEDMFFPAPDFVIEIISKSTERRDRGVKFVDYAKHGVKEYWIVSARKQEIEQYQLSEGIFEIVNTWTEGEIQSVAVPGFRFEVRAVFDSEQHMKWIEKDKQEIVKLNKLMRSKDAELQEKDSVIQEKDSMIQEKDSVIQEKDSVIQEKDSKIHEKEIQIQKLKEQLVKLGITD